MSNGSERYDDGKILRGLDRSIGLEFVIPTRLRDPLTEEEKNAMVLAPL